MRRIRSMHSRQSARREPRMTLSRSRLYVFGGLGIPFRVDLRQRRELLQDLRDVDGAETPTVHAHV
jgi:hypothetical protein